MNVIFRVATATLLLLVAATDAAICDTEGTVVLTSGSDSSAAILVTAGCDEKELTVTKNTLIASDMGIEKVLSVPNVQTLCVHLFIVGQKRGEVFLCANALSGSNFVVTCRSTTYRR